MGPARALAALAALLSGAAALKLEARAGLQGAADPVNLDPADSQTIDGSDCGQVKQIIGKWSKAGKVGRYAGEASGAISGAEAASASAGAAATQAREIGAAFADSTGALPSGIESAAGNAEAAQQDATNAATKLETELGTFKGKISGSDFSGAGVPDADIVKLKDLTAEAINATSFARETAIATVKKAEQVKAQYLKDSGAVAAYSKKVVSSSTAAIEEASDVGQKAGYGVDDAKLLVTKADEAISGLTPLLAEQGEQEPVLQAFIDDLTAKKTGVEEGHAAVTAAIQALAAAGDDLKTKSAAAKAVSAAVAGGAPAPETASEDITAAEEALAEVQQALTAVKAKVKTLMARQATLKAKLTEAQKKLPPPGPA